MKIKYEAKLSILDSIKTKEWFIIIKNGCPYCMKTKVLLDSKKIKYEKEILDEFNQDYIYGKINSFIKNYRLVPIIFYNGEFIGGYNELKIKLNSI